MRATWCTWFTRRKLLRSSHQISYGVCRGSYFEYSYSTAKDQEFLNLELSVDVILSFRKLIFTVNILVRLKERATMMVMTNSTLANWRTIEVILEVMLMIVNKLCYRLKQIMKYNALLFLCSVTKSWQYRSQMHICMLMCKRPESW